MRLGSRRKKECTHVEARETDEDLLLSCSVRESYGDAGRRDERDEADQSKQTPREDDETSILGHPAAFETLLNVLLTLVDLDGRLGGSWGCDGSGGLVRGELAERDEPGVESGVESAESGQEDELGGQEQEREGGEEDEQGTGVAPERAVGSVAVWAEMQRGVGGKDGSASTSKRQHKQEKNTYALCLRAGRSRLSADWI